jgi:hypothetical protein
MVAISQDITSLIYIKTKATLRELNGVELYGVYWHKATGSWSLVKNILFCTLYVEDGNNYYAVSFVKKRRI